MYCQKRILWTSKRYTSITKQYVFLGCKCAGRRC